MKTQKSWLRIPDGAVLDLDQLPIGLLIPTKETILSIHAALIHSGANLGMHTSYEVRDDAALDFFLESEAMKIKFTGKDPVMDSVKLAVDITLFFATRHPFQDGNKRTALLVGLLALAANVNSYCNKKSPRKKYWFDWASSDVQQIRKTKLIVMIADWGSRGRQGRLLGVLKRKGVVPKRHNHLTEGDIRQYLISKYRNLIRIHE